MAEINDIIKIKNKLGLHARPAAMLVQEASKFTSTIEFENDGVKVNGKSIMGVMMLAAAFGSDLHVMINGDDAEDAFNALKVLIDSKFDED